MLDKTYISTTFLADITSVSRRTVQAWEKNGRVRPVSDHPFPKDGKDNYYLYNELSHFPQIKAMQQTDWDAEFQIRPSRPYRSIELFAGAGGLAIGLEQAGFEAVALNEVDKNACQTLRNNRPHWNVLEGDIREIDFTPFTDVDFLSGGFPCQAFSYAGKKMGFEDVRGTLFFEFARAVKELQPKVFMAENVKGLRNHDQGKTLETIKNVIEELGYTLIEPKVLKAMFYQVPQKRERFILIGIRNDLLPYAKFYWPSPYHRVLTVQDGLKQGVLYDADVPQSEGQKYPARKKEIMAYVPAGGNWTDLSDELQREYMKKSYFLGGGKTGMARRLSWGSPSLTLTCAPAQKQTERCHPEETRPLTIREYARIQTFPDEWIFSGSISSQYKQIGNAVPVNLGFALGRQLIALLNRIEEKQPTKQSIIQTNPQLTLLEDKVAYSAEVSL